MTKSEDRDARMYTGEPLEDEDGRVHVPRQQNLGPESEGGGEFPDPDAAPQAPAPGAVKDEPPEE